MSGRLPAYNKNRFTQEMQGKDKIAFMLLSFSACGLIYYCWLVHLPLK